MWSGLQIRGSGGTLEGCGPSIPLRNWPATRSIQLEAQKTQLTAVNTFAARDKTQNLLLYGPHFPSPFSVFSNMRSKPGLA